MHVLLPVDRAAALPRDIAHPETSAAPAGGAVAGAERAARRARGTGRDHPQDAGQAARDALPDPAGGGRPSPSLLRHSCPDDGQPSHRSPAPRRVSLAQRLPPPTPAEQTLMRTRLILFLTIYLVF